jgi:pyruvate dehydrogenase E2 component (dihydrolipoamide acetyltransferase)
MFELKMPQWGMNMTEGTILQWYKKEGDAIAAGDPLAEIEIAKAINTLESPVSGTLSKIIAAVNDTIPVQGLIALIRE